MGQQYYKDDLRAKKSFGQHFLINNQLLQDILGVITTATDNIETPSILEVGPGKGALTHLLNTKFNKLIAVEADRDMVEYLVQKQILPQEKIIFQDILKLDFEDLFQGKPFWIVGNFPYNISSQIVFKIIENYEKVQGMVGMFQKEMAERICAPHGSKTYGITSVLTQSLYEVELNFHIGPQNFSPPPKVESSIITLKLKSDLNIDYPWDVLKKVVKISFGQRRKMLRNTLAGLIEQKEQLEDPIFNKRPEQLSVEDFITLVKKYFTNHS